MIAAFYNYIQHTRGDTINPRTITATDADTGLPIDLTSVDIKSTFTNGDNTKALIIGSGVTLTDAVNGVFEIDVAVLTVVGTWCFDVQLTFVDGSIRTWIKGTITIVDDKTA